MDSENEIINMAEQKLKEQNIEEGIALYEFLLDHSNYNEEVINRLMKIYIQQGSFDLARKVTYKIADEHKPSFFHQLGFLEYIEMNYQAAIQNLEKKIKLDKNQESYIYTLANVQRNLGERRSAKNLYELLLSSRNYGWKAFLSICTLDIENQDYKQLEKRINTVNLNMLKASEKCGYQLFQNILNFYQKGIIDEKVPYAIKQSIENNEEELLRHIEKHHATDIDKNQCFLKYIDLKALIKLAKEQISLTNPCCNATASYYTISTNSIIGMKNDKPTDTFRVVTNWGFPNIITMYPISISEQFNKEGYRENKIILEKRLGGGGKLSETRRKNNCINRLFSKTYSDFHYNSYLYEYSIQNDSRVNTRWYFSKRSKRML